jgi:hypothetical protein
MKNQFTLSTDRVTNKRQKLAGSLVRELKIETGRIPEVKLSRGEIPEKQRPKRVQIRTRPHNPIGKNTASFSNSCAGTWGRGATWRPRLTRQKKSAEENRQH